MKLFMGFLINSMRTVLHKGDSKARDYVWSSYPSSCGEEWEKHPSQRTVIFFCYAGWLVSCEQKKLAGEHQLESCTVVRWWKPHTALCILGLLCTCYLLTTLPHHPCPNKPSPWPGPRRCSSWWDPGSPSEPVFGLLCNIHKLLEPDWREVSLFSSNN